MSEAFGPGREGPLLVVVDGRDLPPTTAPAAFDEVAAWAADQDDVANAQVVGDERGRAPAPRCMITPTSGPDDTATEDLLTDLRDGQAGIEERDRHRPSASPA